MMEVTDFDAFLPPSPKKAVKINGETHAVYDLLDLSRNELNQLLSFEQRAATMPDEAQYAELKAHILRLVPTMTEEKLDEMSLRRVGALFAYVQRVAAPEVPDPLATSPNA